MPHVPKRIEVVDEAVAAILRTKTPAERIATAFDAFETAWQMTTAQVMRQHPTWADAQIRSEVARRLTLEQTDLLHQFPPRGSRLFALICAIVATIVVPCALQICFGAVAGPGAALHVADADPWARLDGNYSGRYKVWSFGKVVYERSIPGEDRFDLEQTLWLGPPLLSLVAVSAVLGWYSGRWFSVVVLKYDPY